MATTHAHTKRRGAVRRTLLFSTSLTALIVGLPAPAPPSSSLNPAEEHEAHEGRAPTAFELQRSVEAAFARESYPPRATARLLISNRARGMTLGIFRVGPELERTRGNAEMRGVAVSRTRRIGDSRGHRRVLVRIGDWPSGLYFARLEARDGRLGFAPFVVRPRRLGEHSVAVVLPTFTWQAYNLRDDDGDGKGDSWYAHWKHRTVRLGRPFLNRGVPSNFRCYDLPFLRWLARTGKAVDYLSDADLGAAHSAGVLARAYDLIVFPGHHEYVTKREYDLVESYRNRGGNLMFLSANNFFWRVERRGRIIEKSRQWRDLGRPESALIGVQYAGNDDGSRRAPWIVRRSRAARWFLAGTGLTTGSAFGYGGIEIDKRTAASPRGVQVLAEIPNLFGRGFSAQMTYYETRAGARVFAAGAFMFAGWADRTIVGRRMLENLWERLAPGHARAIPSSSELP
jgi:hypothetical protein